VALENFGVRAAYPTWLHDLLAIDDYSQLFATFAYAKTARQRFLERFDRQHG
jgi:hypothetical protein